MTLARHGVIQTIFALARSISTTKLFTAEPQVQHSADSKQLPKFIAITGSM